MNNPDHLCPVCHAPMNDAVQKWGITGIPDTPISTCQNNRCKLFGVTLTAGKHEKLSKDEIEAYARAKGKRE